MRVLAWPAYRVGDTNPFTRLLYDHVQSSGVVVHDFTPWCALKGRYAIFHLHWPEYFLVHRNPLKAIVGSLGLLFLTTWIRIRGAKVVWTVHNLGSHNQTRARAGKCFWKLFVRRLDGYVALTENGKVAIERRFPYLRCIPGFVIPHGHYREAYPSYLSREEARRRLGIASDAKVILFFGTIAEYKNVPSLIKVFREMQNPEATLLIAGACISSTEGYSIRREAERDSRVKLHFGFVPRDQVQLFFVGSDLVVLPFRDIFNSGSVVLALSFDRPVLVPASGAMPELQLQIGKEWMQTYLGDLSEGSLKAALSWATAERRPRKAPLDCLEWGQVGKRTIAAYRHLLTRCDRPKIAS